MNALFKYDNVKQLAILLSKSVLHDQPTHVGPESG